ncbi:MAG: BatD family protein, partial [Candidatus Omnitrophota bacterium]
FSEADNGDKSPIELSAEVDKDRVNIGDRVKLDISVKNASGKEVAFPESQKNLGEFTVLDSYSLEDGRVYVLSIYTTGTHVIPPVTVEYREKGEDQWHAKVSPQVPIEVLSVLTGDDKDIKDIKGLVTIGGIPVWGFFAVALAALAAFIFLFWRRRKQRIAEEEIRRKPAHVIAYEELNNLRGEDLPAKGRVKEYYIRLSDIVRHYLEKRFSYRAPEMTTEEFLKAIKESKEFDKECKDLLKEFLSHCDMVKFAKYGPTPLEILDSFKSAERLIDRTRIAEEEAEA